jgi:hypothetical protein
MGTNIALSVTSRTNNTPSWFSAEYSVSLLGGIRSRRILLLCGFRNLDVVLDAKHVDFLLASKYVALVLRYTKVVIFVVKKTNTRMVGLDP